MSTHRFTSSNVARIPATAVERGERAEVTQLRALLQGLGDHLVSFTENDDPAVTEMLEALLRGGGFKLGSGDPQNGVWLTVETVGNPLKGMSEIVALNGGHKLKRSEIEARLPELLREAGIDPESIGKIEHEEMINEIFGRYASLDPVELDEMEA